MDTVTKSTISASMFIAYLAHVFNEIVIALIFMMAADYITGVMAAFIEKRLNPDVGRKGALKKVGFFFLIFLAFVLDFVISYMAQKLGVGINTKGVFGIATCCWLIGTEALSITDNLSRMGVPVPKFLINAYSRIKELCEKVPEKACNENLCKESSCKDSSCKDSSCKDSSCKDSSCKDK